MTLLSIITAFILCVMAKTPLKCPSTGQELECGAGVNVNDSAHVDLVKKNREKILVTGATVLAVFLAASGPAEAKSRFSAGLNNTDLVMDNLFWIGVYPGLNSRMLSFVISCFSNFFKGI